MKISLNSKLVLGIGIAFSLMMSSVIAAQEEEPGGPAAVAHRAPKPDPAVLCPACLKALTVQLDKEITALGDEADRMHLRFSQITADLQEHKALSVASYKERQKHFAAELKGMLARQHHIDGQHAEIAAQQNAISARWAVLAAQSPAK